MRETFDKNRTGSRTSREMTLAEASAMAWMWMGEAGAWNDRGVAGAEEREAYMWLKPSFEPIVATTSWSGSSCTPKRVS